MKKKQPFTCMLCARSGRKTLAPPAKLGWAICEDCNDALAPRAWCNKGAHVVEAEPWIKNGCRACQSAARRERWANDPDFRAKQRQATKAWKAAHADHIRAYDRRYHQVYRRPPQTRRSWWRVRWESDPAFREQHRTYNRAYKAWCRAAKKRRAA